MLPIEYFCYNVISHVCVSRIILYNSSFDFVMFVSIILALFFSWPAVFFTYTFHYFTILLVYNMIQSTVFFYV